MALTIQSLRTKDAIAELLSLKVSTVATVLNFLKRAGLAEQKGMEFFPTNKSIYLGQDSPLICQHHANWRVQALASLDPQSREDLHYSAVVTIPQSEFTRIKAIFAKAIEEARQHWVGAVNEEQLCAVTLDWFSLNQPKPAKE